MKSTFSGPACADSDVLACHREEPKARLKVDIELDILFPPKGG
ncbi:MAG: hypothetical protein ABSF83_15390 [Nitrososphaerales archaeon]|jgi:hypothetical protein